jgi:hypothetical protein
MLDPPTIKQPAAGMVCLIPHCLLFRTVRPGSVTLTTRLGRSTDVPTRRRSRPGSSVTGSFRRRS